MPQVRWNATVAATVSIVVVMINIGATFIRIGEIKNDIQVTKDSIKRIDDCMANKAEARDVANWVSANEARQQEIKHELSNKVDKELYKALHNDLVDKISKNTSKLDRLLEMIMADMKINKELRDKGI